MKGYDSSPIRVVSLTAESREPRDSYGNGSSDYDEKYQQNSYMKQEYDQKSNSSELSWFDLSCSVGWPVD